MAFTTFSSGTSWQSNDKCESSKYESESKYGSTANIEAAKQYFRHSRRFRKELETLVGDVSQMYHQLLLKPEDRPLQRFLWWNLEVHNRPQCTNIQDLCLAGATARFAPSSPSKHTLKITRQSTLWPQKQFNATVTWTTWCHRYQTLRSPRKPVDN